MPAGASQERQRNEREERMAKRELGWSKAAKGKDAGKAAKEANPENANPQAPPDEMIAA